LRGAARDWGAKSSSKLISVRFEGIQECASFYSRKSLAPRISGQWSASAPLPNLWRIQQRCAAPQSAPRRGLCWRREARTARSTCGTMGTRAMFGHLGTTNQPWRCFVLSQASRTLCLVRRMGHSRSLTSTRAAWRATWAAIRSTFLPSCTTPMASSSCLAAWTAP